MSQQNKTEELKMDMPQAELPKHSPQGIPRSKSNEGGIFRQISGKFRRPSDATLHESVVADLEPPQTATATTKIYQRSSSYTHLFPEEEYTYPSDAAVATAPAVIAEKYDSSAPPPPYEFAEAVVEPKVAPAMDLAARFEALQKKN